MAIQPEGLEFIEVEDIGEGQRLDVYLATRLTGFSRTKIQEMLRTERILLNGLSSKPSTILDVGDSISVNPPDAKPQHLTPVAMPLEILFEDDHLIVLVKPPGIVVHPGAGETGPTLVQGLLFHLNQNKTSISRPESLRPGIVHRLDKDTSGIMVCAKNDKTHAGLARQFAEKTNLRQYVALLDGLMDKKSILRESYLHRDPKSRLRFASLPVRDFERLAADNRDSASLKSYRYAKSLFDREQTFGGRITQASIRLFTGRTHQIRVHAKDLGVPVVGDPLYHHPTELPHSFDSPVRAGFLGIKRQMLHAAVLGFVHPETGDELQFSAPPPEDFQHLVHLLTPYRD